VKTLYVICEGQTEQRFTDQVLAPHLFGHDFVHVPTIRVEFSRHRRVIFRGGVRRYAPVRRTLVNIMKDRPQTDIFFTTMLDLYALPREFPGRQGRKRNPDDPYPFVRALEAAFAKDVGDHRFVPHIQLHEYETLLFADPSAFGISFDDCDTAIANLKTIAAAFPSIEHIDDGKTTGPSKRIIEVLPEYEHRKTDAGPDIAETIGLQTIRQKCSHFDKWISKLEKLRPPAGGS
jgi:hypothetical protein